MHTLSETDPVRYGRRAFGVQRPTSPEQRAQYIAESILLHQDEGRTRTLADYGIDHNSAMAALVAAWLTKLAR
jgi:hypothetical protein